MSMRKTQWALLMAAGVLALSGCDNGNDDTSNGAPLPIGTDSNSYLVTSAGRLVGFDLKNPSRAANTSTISGLATGDSIVAIAVRQNGGKLYAVTSTSSGVGSLYTLDPTTGVATLVASLNTGGSTPTAVTLNGTTFSAAFNAVPDRLRIVSNTGQNLRVNADDGSVTTDTAINGATTSPDGVAYTNQFNDACSTTIYYINSSTDQLYTAANPNAGTTTAVAPLTDAQGRALDSTSSRLLDSTSFTGSFNSGPSNILYGVLTVNGVAGLYRLDTVTAAATDTTLSTTAGKATFLANLPLASGETVLGSATTSLTNTASPAQVVDAYALTYKTVTPSGANPSGESYRLVSFNWTNPTKLCSNRSISAGGVINGSTGDEKLVGVDRKISGAVNPGTGTRTDPTTLYAVGISTSVATKGTLYTITNIGGATAALTDATGSSVAAQCALTFPTALTGTNFGVNFNPVVNRIRLVSDAGENFRINPVVTFAADGSCTAAVTVDTTLTPATSKVASVSYTNAAATTSTSGTGTTTLYGIDSTAKSLVRIGADPATTGACTPTPDAGNPNCGVVTTVGSLTGLPAGTLQTPVGFEISNYTGNTAYGAFAVDTATTPATASTLYTISTTNGAVTSVGVIGPSTTGSSSTIGTVKSLTTKGN